MRRARGDTALRAFGRLDVLFNNAGVGTMVVGGTVETIDLEHWDLAQDVNVRAMYLVSRAAVPAMRAVGGGSIVNTSSVSAFRGSVGRGRATRTRRRRARCSRSPARWRRPTAATASA